MDAIFRTLAGQGSTNLVLKVARPRRGRWVASIHFKTPPKGEPQYPIAMPIKRKGALLGGVGSAPAEALAVLEVVCSRVLASRGTAA